MGSKSSHRRCSVEKEPEGLQPKETQAQVFSGEICVFFTKTYFEKHLRTTASRVRKIIFSRNPLLGIATVFA